MLVLKTERLRLRWFEPGDVAHVLAQISEDSWKLNIRDPGVRDLDGARVWMEEKLFNWYWPAGLGLWAMERSSDGRLLGMCGLLQRPHLPAPDIGYALLPEFWGGGYAREAAQACRDYALQVLGEAQLFGSTATFNAASGKVLEGLGMQLIATGPLGDEPGDSHLYALGEASQQSEEAQIRDLVHRYFAAFDNRAGRHAPLAALPYFLLPQALISHAVPVPSTEWPSGLRLQTVPDFVSAQAQLLQDGGALREYSAWVTALRIEQRGRIAQAWLSYRESGVLDGEAFEREGEQGLQLLKLGRRWRIAAVAVQPGE